MTVPADSAKDQVQTATTGLVDLRENNRWAGGSHMYDGGEQLVTGWHFHDVHEIEYALPWGSGGQDAGGSLPAATPPSRVDPGGPAASDDVER